MSVWTGDSTVLSSPIPLLIQRAGMGASEATRTDLDGPLPGLPAYRDQVMAVELNLRERRVTPTETLPKRVTSRTGSGATDLRSDIAAAENPSRRSTTPPARSIFRHCGTNASCVVTVVAMRTSSRDSSLESTARRCNCRHVPSPGFPAIGCWTKRRGTAGSHFVIPLKHDPHSRRASPDHCPAPGLGITNLTAPVACGASKLGGVHPLETRRELSCHSPVTSIPTPAS